jgi:hypothetical protein
MDVTAWENLLKILFPALSDHRIDEEQVLARMIEVEPLIRPGKGDRVF